MLKNILLIGYDSNICLGVSYCLNKMGNCRILLLTNNKRNAGKYSRFIKKIYYYEDKRLEITQLNDIVIRSTNVSTPNGVRVLAEFDVLDGGTY